MKRIHYPDYKLLENKRVDRFLDEVLEVCKKHGLSISHEDGHGSFLIENHNESDAQWLRDSSVCASVKDMDYE